MKQTAMSGDEVRAAEQSRWERLLYQQIENAALPTPERQYHIYMPGARNPCRADFCWPVHKLIVEVQGGQWIRGRHTRGGKSFETECRKLAWFAVLGFHFMPITPAMIEDDTALLRIRQFLEEEGLNHEHS